MNLTLSDIARRCGGVLLHADGALTVDSVVTDSRDVVVGAMFVAIAGDHVDGHDFAPQAINAGAVAVLTARDIGQACVVVDDPVQALGRLAASVRRDLAARTIAVTGSSGKTSTKDLIAAVLVAAGRTVSPVGSFNTEVGLPLTILGAPADTEFLVLEMGMRGRGHIAYLVDIAAPHIGVVTNVGSAHMELLGSHAQIALAKSELVQGLPETGTAILNGDDALVRDMARLTSAHVVLVGESSDCQVRASEIVLDDQARASFMVVDHASEQTAKVSLKVSGRHQVANALSAVGVGLAVGMSLGDIAAQLDDAAPVSPWRMEVVRLPSGITIVNDSYNANPESVRAALEALVAMPGRTWAVLGEMRELGDQADVAHEEVGRTTVRLGVQNSIFIGAGTRPAHLGALAEGAVGEESMLVPDVESAKRLLQDRLRPGDVVLIKASRSIGLDRLATALIEGGRA